MMLSAGMLVPGLGPLEPVPGEVAGCAAPLASLPAGLPASLPAGCPAAGSPAGKKRPREEEELLHLVLCIHKIFWPQGGLANLPNIHPLNIKFETYVTIKLILDI